MKHFYILLLIGLLLSCQQEELEVHQKGHLEMVAECENVVTERISRAVADGLIVEIWRDGSLYVEGERTYRFLPGSFPRTLTLPIGEYVVKAFSPSFEQVEKWTNSDYGDRVYYAEVPVKIESDKVCRMELSVPMQNVGISFSLPEDLRPFITEYSFTLIQNDFQGHVQRVVKLKEGQTVYVDAATFSYHLSVTNVDQEIYTLDSVQKQVDSGKIYHIAYTFVDNALEGASV